MKTFAALVLALMAACILLLQQGESGFDFLAFLLSSDHQLSKGQQFVLFELRLPPVVAGVFAGASFGLAGAIFQNQFRNPLASPDVLGVTAGASAAVLATSVLNLNVPVQLAAVLGGLGVAALVFVLGWQRGDQLTKLVITGLSLGYLATGVTSYLLAKSENHEAATAFAWLVGSTRMATNASIIGVIGVFAAAAIFIAISSKPTKAFELGSAKAETLGFTINRWTLSLIAVAVLLTAFATAAVGPIAFVALLSGPIAGSLNRGRSNIFALASVIGACLVILSDLLIALVFSGAHLPTGLITGLLGAGFLITLIFRKRGQEGV